MPAKKPAAQTQSSEEKPRIVLIDGHSLIFRSFMVFQGSGTSKAMEFSIKKTGEVTTAVYGFTSTLLSILTLLKPTHLAVALDAPGPTFRHEKSESYKATRAALPDELRQQSKRIRQVLDAFDMPVLEVPGYEADDVLGALARQAKAQGVPVTLVTLDSDLLQLVEPGVDVFMYRPYIKAAPAVHYDVAAVNERYGFAPERIPDYKGLKGDTSDNIPGVPGIGEKTATKLLQDFGSVEGIYEHIDLVTPPKLQEKLREHEGQARFSKEMATIERDAPVTLDIEQCRLRRFDRTRVEELFHELEFRSLLSRIPDDMGIEAATAPKAKKDQIPTAYRTIMSKKDLAALVKEITAAGRIGLCIEHSDTHAMRGAMVGIAVSTAPGNAAYVPIGHQPELGGAEQMPLADVLDALGPALEDEKIQKVTHNGKHAFLVLATAGAREAGAPRDGRPGSVLPGVELRGLRFDTMIAAYLLGESNMTIQTLAYDRLSMAVPRPDELLGKPGKNRLTMPAVAIDAACGYCCAQADAQLRAADVLAAELKQRNLWPLFDDVEMPLMCTLARMELTGVAVDPEQLVAMSREMQAELKRIEQEIYASVGHEFNIGSPQQLSQVLFEELNLPKSRRTKSGYTTDALAMDALRGVHPVIDLIMSYRGIHKLKSTYVDALPGLIHPKTKRIHTTFNQVTAATGRLSSNDPNLQNIPVRTGYGNKIRRAFIARDIGKEPMLLAADYSQIELRIMAHLSQDPALIEAFRADEDIHAATASNVFAVPFDEVTPEQRRRAKVFNFGVLYGLSEYGLSTKERIPREEAATFIKRYFEKYEKVKAWRDGAIESCRRLGYAETLMGRRRYIPEIKSPNFQVRGSGERMAINMPVQGTASDIIKVAMNRIDEEMREKKLQTRMILQVHDELIFEGPRAEIDQVREMALRIMPKSLDLVVPLKIDIKTGKNWGELEVAKGPLLSEAEAELEFAETAG